MISIRENLKTVLVGRIPAPTIDNVLDELINLKLISKNEALRYLIRKRYDEMRKGGIKSIRDCMIDLEIEFDTTSAFIRTTLYPCKKV